MTVADWWNYQVSDQCIGCRQCLRNAASVRAVGDIQFRCDFLVGQLNQPIAMWLLMQNRLQVLLVIGAAAKLQLIYRPLLVMLPITVV